MYCKTKLCTVFCMVWGEQNAGGLICVLDEFVSLRPCVCVCRYGCMLF